MVGTLWFLAIVGVSGGGVGAAFAAEPPVFTPAPDAEGTWRTQLVFPVPIEAVRAALGDPIEAARFSPDITTIAYVSREQCPTIRVETGMTFAPVAYDYRRCATSTGWHETLVASKALEIYDVRWSFESVEAGTKVTYDVRIKPSFPAPDFLLARQMRGSITTLLQRLYRSVTGG
ncbi:MAG: SRPBCC family protein [Pseudomonadota bacterium]|nr:SRPBCC family protein [Pseudomonadota bacterium]